MIVFFLISTVTFEHVCRVHTKRQVIIKMNKFNMFITAVRLRLIFDQITMAQEQKYLRSKVSIQSIMVCFR